MPSKMNKTIRAAVAYGKKIDKKAETSIVKALDSATKQIEESSNFPIMLLNFFEKPRRLACICLHFNAFAKLISGKPVVASRMESDTSAALGMIRDATVLEIFPNPNSFQILVESPIFDFVLVGDVVPLVYLSFSLISKNGQKTILKSGSGKINKNDADKSFMGRVSSRMKVLEEIEESK